MHPNPTFRRTDQVQSLSFAKDRAFGTLAVNGDAGPLLSHIPFLLADDGSHADLHLVRSNPICKAISDGAAARLDVLGPDGYISPDWYGLDDQVPTWNYVAVHLIGTLRPLPVDTLDDLLARQSAFYEDRLDKAPWRMDKLSDDTHTKFLRMILPFRLEVTQIDSTWKLGQNKPSAARQAAAQSVETGLGQELAALAALMRDPPS